MAWGPERDNRFTTGAGPAGEAPVVAGSEPSELDAADALARFASDARVEERVAARRRQRWLAQATSEGSTFAGLLLSVAEIGAPISVMTSSGTTHRGVVFALGTDVVALRVGPLDVTLVALEQVVALDAGRTEPISSDRHDGPPPDGPRLRHLLFELAEEQPDATFCLAGGLTMRGALRWVGQDVVAISQPTGEERSTRRDLRYVRLSSVAAVSVRVSG
jgi:hypothetical protein